MNIWEMRLPLGLGMDQHSNVLLGVCFDRIGVRLNAFRSERAKLIFLILKLEFVAFDACQSPFALTPSRKFTVGLFNRGRSFERFFCNANQKKRVSDCVNWSSAKEKRKWKREREKKAKCTYLESAQKFRILVWRRSNYKWNRPTVTCTLFRWSDLHGKAVLWQHQIEPEAKRIRLNERKKTKTKMKL